MHKGASHRHIVLFWLILLLPLVLGIFGYREGNFENRKLAPSPVFVTGSLFDEGFYRGVSAWLEDHIPLRNIAVAVKSLLVRGGISANSFTSVVQGSDGWLYLSDSLHKNCGEAPARQALTQRLKRFAALLAAQGKTLYLVIPPNKAAIYPEHLPDWIKGEYAVTERSNAQQRKQLGSVTGLEFIDIEPALQAKKRAGGPQLYYSTDTHWNCHGARLLATALVEGIRPGLSRPVTIDEAHSSQLDLDRLIGHHVQRPFMLCSSNDDGYRPVPVERKGGIKGRHFTRSDGPGGLIGGKTLFVYDSFMDALLPDVLPGYFADVLFVHANDCGHPKTFAEEIRKADRVVLELVERNFCQWSRYVIASPALQAELAP